MVERRNLLANSLSKGLYLMHGRDTHRLFVIHSRRYYCIEVIRDHSITVTEVDRFEIIILYMQG